MSDDLSAEFQTNIPLFEMLQSLRQELAASAAEAKDRDLRFAVEKIDVELEVGVKCTKNGKGKFSFWVVTAEGGGAKERAIAANFKISLTPVVEGHPGRRLEVSDVITEGGPAGR